MLLLGVDVGTSSIKVSVVDSGTGDVLASTQYPESESPILTPQKGWAEQDPDMWWSHVQHAILRCNQEGKYDPQDISAIGIAYQMHGLVVVDKQGRSLRNSIIWCDSRAVEIGEKAMQAIGKENVLSSLLNSPGNFTASKLAWVRDKEPDIYRQVWKIMLPGDYIAYKFTGEATTTVSALSEGVFWDFKEHRLSADVFKYFGFEEELIPEIRPLFGPHGGLSKSIAEKLGLKAGIPLAYKAGDQLNNALSLNVTEPGDVAATAGTSGVIYGVTDRMMADQQSRVNTFAHVNHNADKPRLGVLLCINGAGSMNRWIRDLTGHALSYEAINEAASAVCAGSDGVRVLPFGNGAERMLNNRLPGAQLRNIDLNIHSRAHIFRAVQEGIAFSFRYGLDILKENGVQPVVIRAGYSNLFLSRVFAQSFVNATRVPVELHSGDGSYGAAVGAGIGIGTYSSANDLFTRRAKIATIAPTENLEDHYQDWKELLTSCITS
ncbi:xylulokinase [Pedobacter faecalis]|uniref:xylulokinase n=1 Tax=Pedobacter faecalis TaxID=3041495 RepID=UPI00254E9287|nr:FGGY family carbohydrate kinase [Pedobacter sp. ELA7]